MDVDEVRCRRHGGRGFSGRRLDRGADGRGVGACGGSNRSGQDPVPRRAGVAHPDRVAAHESVDGKSNRRRRRSDSRPATTINLARQLKDDEVQLGVFHGVEFAWVHQKYPTLKPLVIAVNGPAYLRTHLVVRADSKIASAANLKGKVVELPRMSSEHVRLFLERRCCPPGEKQEKYFAKVITTSNPIDALDDVVDDDAQAVVVDEAAYEAYQKNKPGRAAKLKTVQQSEPFPCAVIAYQPGVLSESVLNAFRDGLIAAKDNPKAQQLLKANRVTGFEAIPTDYEKSLEEIAKAYPAP